MKAGFAWTLFIVAALCFGLVGTGCKKQGPAGQTAAQTFEHLPEATNVTAALDQKDFETAVSSLPKIKESATTPEQQQEYRALLELVKNKVLEASATDPKAAEAMQALRLMITGR
jgi:glutamine synthetase adenylyltransferase